MLQLRVESEKLSKLIYRIITCRPPLDAFHTLAVLSSEPVTISWSLGDTTQQLMSLEGLIFIQYVAYPSKSPEEQHFLELENVGLLYLLVGFLSVNTLDISKTICTRGLP